MLEGCIDRLIGAAQLQKNVEINIILGAFLLENEMTVYIVIFDRKAYQISGKLFLSDPQTTELLKVLVNKV